MGFAVNLFPNGWFLNACYLSKTSFNDIAVAHALLLFIRPIFQIHFDISGKKKTRSKQWQKGALKSDKEPVVPSYETRVHCDRHVHTPFAQTKKDTAHSKNQSFFKTSCTWRFFKLKRCISIHKDSLVCQYDTTFSVPIINVTLSCKHFIACTLQALQSTTYRCASKLLSAH